MRMQRSLRLLRPTHPVVSKNTLRVLLNANPRGLRLAAANDLPFSRLEKRHQCESTNPWSVRPSEQIRAPTSNRPWRLTRACEGVSPAGRSVAVRDLRKSSRVIFQAPAHTLLSARWRYHRLRFANGSLPYSFSNLSIIIFSTFLGTSLGVTFQHTSRLSEWASCQMYLPPLCPDRFPWPDRM
jgi:hypothetical protein